MEPVNTFVNSLMNTNFSQGEWAGLVLTFFFMVISLGGIIYGVYQDLMLIQERKRCARHRRTSYY